MVSSGGDREAEEWSEMGPHDEFLELCAVSTSGDLTEEERKKLRFHLAGCAECQQALREFDTAVDFGVPVLASELAAVPSEKPSSPQRELARRLSLNGAASETPEKEPRVWTGGENGGFAVAQRNGHKRSQVNWNYVWMSFAACILLTIALGIHSHGIGRGHNTEVSQVTAGTAEARVEALEQRMSDAGHEREVLRAQLAQRDQVIAVLRRQTEQESGSLNELESAQANLEDSLQNGDAEKQRVSDERASLAQEFEATQASLQKMQSELDLARRQRAQDGSLQNQIKDLSEQLREQEQTVGKKGELLSQDRDIRELMGARDLYIAEVYDVARDGATPKPYGRVFYTKGKSLIFYGYDLDQQAGVRNASTFQAWGRRGPDEEQPLSLGIFYEDNAAKKRWVLKFNDPKALDEIDAIFVTIEPNGGSRKPSGKPLLYAHLQIAPNHSSSHLRLICSVCSSMPAEWYMFPAMSGLSPGRVFAGFPFAFLPALLIAPGAGVY
jgi:hypothetical protein